MAMEHKERKRWCEEISRINKKMSAGEGDKKNIFDIF